MTKPRLTKDKYIEDLDYFFKTLREVHPKLDFVLSNEEFLCLEREVYSRVEAGPNTETLLSSLREFLNRFGDSHTFVSGSHTPVAGAPVKLILIEDKIVVESIIETKEKPQKLDIKRGDIILEIEGISTEEALLKAVKNIPHQNLGWAKRQALQRILKFPATTGEISLLISRNKETRTFTLPLFTKDQLVLKNQFKHVTDPFSYKFDDEFGTGIFNYKSCYERAIFENDEKKRKFLENIGASLDSIPDLEETCWTFFSRLKEKGYKRLVLDLRGNGGGSAKMNQIIYKYLTDIDLKTYRVQVKVSEQLLGVNSEYKDAAVGDLFTYKYEDLKYPYVSRLTESQLEEIPRFQGDIYVLIDPLVYSSGEWIAAELKASGIGTFIGEPTGGGGSRPGDILVFRMPNSNVPFRVSHKLFVMPGQNDYPGVTPHHEVNQTMEDFMEGKDTVMEYVKALG